MIILHQVVHLYTDSEIQSLIRFLDKRDLQDYRLSPPRQTSVHNSGREVVWGDFVLTVKPAPLCQPQHLRERRQQGALVSKTRLCAPAVSDGQSWSSGCRD